jgi:hypothetical protein
MREIYFSFLLQSVFEGVSIGIVELQSFLDLFESDSVSAIILSVFRKIRVRDAEINVLLVSNE